MTGGYKRIVADECRARQVATDGSVRGDWAASAWLSDVGGWYVVDVTPPRRIRGSFAVLHAELRAIGLAVRYHPGPVEVVTDSEPCALLVRRWQTGERAQIRCDDDGEFAAVANLIRARTEPLTVTWVRGHGRHRLNRGADALARLGSRRDRDGLTPEQMRRTADEIAATYTVQFRGFREAS